jgi:myo-inositol-1-phosphate synthase
MAVGVWLFGARGSVAVTAMAGASAVRAGIAGPAGCVTALTPFDGANLPGFAELVFGGHDIVETPVGKRVGALADDGVLPAAVVRAIQADLDAVERSIRPAPRTGTQAVQASVIVEDILAWKRRHRLDHAVAINVASTEPAGSPHPAHTDLDRLEQALAGRETALSPSSLHAYAAMRAGCSFVDFTPSAGAALPALDQLAARERVPYAGRDGKTGETLLRSVLAPMFATRNLPVHSWSGANLLGGSDGASLAHADVNAAKVASKSRVLREILRHQPEGHTRIDFVPDLGEFKTAWDLVTFSGFLGTRMRLEFTWHGCDSALAAPLVLDLARLTTAAHRVGRTGCLSELAFFFKDPLGDEVPGHGLADQWTALCRFAAELGGAAA